MPEFLEYFDPRREAMTELLRALVEIESPTTVKADVDRLGARIAAELSALDAAVRFERQERAGDHIVARWNAEGNERGALILCHMDTVWDTGTLERRPCRIQDGRLYGPGAYDMKAGIVIALFALAGLRALERRPRWPVTLLVTSDEERGSRTSRVLIEAEAARSRIVFCMEPALSSGALKTFRKGTGLYHVVATGRSSHAGADHQAGINAIEEIALQIAALQQLTDYASGTTLNVGRVTGGTRTNVVPDRAECWVDLRVTTRAEGARMHALLTGLQPHLPGARVSVKGALNRPPMERNERMLATFAHAQAIAASLGMAVEQGESGGGSDANFTAALGVPTLDGLGAVGNGAHALDEHVVLESLPQRAALLAALLSHW